MKSFSGRRKSTNEQQLAEFFRSKQALELISSDNFNEHGHVATATLSTMMLLNLHSPLVWHSHVNLRLEIQIVSLKCFRCFALKTFFRILD
jgi:hypothetical protein